MNISPRLKTIADLVPKDSIVADIGTDHAYIPVYLIKEGRAKYAIACDINLGPLENALKTIKEYSYTEYIETRLGNGLNPLKPNEVSAVIIAGMGGILISEILNGNSDITDTIKHFILQPMNAQDELRRWLEKNHFYIENEKLSKEGNKLYEVIYAVRGNMVIEDDIYYEIGRKLIQNKDPLLREFIMLKIKKYKKIYNMVKEENTDKANNKKNEIDSKIKKLQEVLKCL